jgi:hypothetical protein
LGQSQNESAILGLRGTWQRLEETARRYGVFAAALGLQYHALRKLARVEILKVMRLARSSPPAPDPSTPEGLNVRFAHRDELLRAAALPPYKSEMTPEFVAAALAEGQECFGVFDGTTLASWGWLSSHSALLYEALYISLDPRWVYTYKGYTLPAYRGRGLYGVGLHFALKSWEQRRAHGLICCVQSDNFASLRASAHAGYREVGAIYLWYTRSHLRVRISSSCAPYGVRTEFRLGT